MMMRQYWMMLPTDFLNVKNSDAVHVVPVSHTLITKPVCAGHVKMRRPFGASGQEKQARI
jgi:hypothetical protein